MIRIMITRLVAVLSAVAVLTACAPAADRSEAPPTSTDTSQSDAVMRIVDDVMRQSHLKAVIIRVTEGGREVLTPQP